MADMSEEGLLSIVDDAEKDAISHNSDLRKLNRYYLERYFCMPYGDEEEGRSQAVATDSQDTVESDMPSIARVFLGANDIMSFPSRTSNEREIAEAAEKTKYINWLIRGQDESYKTQYDFLKSVEIEKTGVQKFFYEEKEEVSEVSMSGLQTEEWVLWLEDISEDVEEVLRIELNGEKDDGKKAPKNPLGPDDEATFKITKKIKRFLIQGVPGENFLISRNATSKDTAQLVGDQGTITKGELIAANYDTVTDEEIKAMPPAGRDTADTGDIKHVRFKDQGGVETSSPINDWPNHLVKFSDLYLRVDFDNDGIPELRRVYKAGGKILINDSFPLAPYAMASAIPMSYTAIGRSRVELTVQGGWVKTVLERNMLDNTYSAVKGRVVVNDQRTNIDDLSVVRNNGIVRTKDLIPANSVAQLSAPFIGTEIQQVIQYMDFKRSQSLGTFLANQGLDADKFYNETATRFDGIDESNTAKIELVARNIAETGYRELYSGLAKLVAFQQKFPIEIPVDGVPTLIDPRKWRFDHPVQSEVGLGAGDDEKILENMAVIGNVQNQLKAEGSILVDETKRYNVLKRSVKSLGMRPQEFFNNPEVPDEMLAATVEQLMPQNEQLMEAVEQMQLQLKASNQLADAEKVKQQTELFKAQNDGEFNLIKLRSEMQKHFDELMFKYTELQAKENVEVVGQGNPVIEKGDNG